MIVTPGSIPARDMTQSTETACCHALKDRDKNLQVVQDLETQRWDPDYPEWSGAAKLVAMRRYQRCLDALEGLIVARMFELTKMNMSQTGE
jgi:hypothetical protein